MADMQTAVEVLARALWTHRHPLGQPPSSENPHDYHTQARALLAEIEPLIRTPDPMLAEALEALREVSQALAWQCYGECRGWSDNLLRPGAALDRARAVLAKEEGR